MREVDPFTGHNLNRSDFCPVNGVHLNLKTARRTHSTIDSISRNSAVISGKKVTPISISLLYLLAYKQRQHDS